MTATPDDDPPRPAPSLATSDPEAVGLDPLRLAQATDGVAALPEARALLVAREGSLVLERYLDPERRDAPRNVKSVTKSVQSALVGIALRDGLLSRLDQPVVEIVPTFGDDPPRGLDLGWAQWHASSAALRRRITVRHLLTMRSGFFGSDTDEGYVTILAHAPGQVAFAESLPVTSQPGSTFRYNTANAMLLNGVIAAVTGTGPAAFARARLFEPIGAHLDRWRTDRAGLEIGGAELDMSARDMLRLGLLYLGRGQLGGLRVLPESWVDESLTAQVRFADPPTDPAAALLPGAKGYGLMWWLRASGEVDMWCAWGFGGQLVCLVPEADLVVVVQSSLGLNARYQRHLLGLVDEEIVAPLLG